MGYDFTDADRAKARQTQAAKKADPNYKPAMTKLAEISAIQRHLLNVITTGNVPASAIASCANAYEKQEWLRRAVLGLPNPKPIEVERKRKPKTPVGSAAPIEP